MTPSINGILFVLSALFGLNTVFIAEESKLILDLESKTATIEYFDVKTPIQVIEHAEEGLKSIEQGVVFPSGQAWLKLDSSTFEKKDDQLNALVTLSFTDEFELLKLMNFNQTHFGKQTPSDEFHY